MNLIFDKGAVKTLRKMQPKAAAAMLARLKVIAADPLANLPNVEIMKGTPDAFRLRQGDWRAIYVLDRKADVMRVVKIGQRGQVYR